MNNAEVLVGAEEKASPHESEHSPKVISTKDLFGPAREICIEHDGAFYRLRITRRGKLILQK